MIDTGGPNALVRACFPTRDGKFMVSLQMNRSAGGGLLTLDHDKPVDKGSSVRVEGGKIVGRG